MESLFVCPVCGGALERGEHAYRCAAGHSYDIAAAGYTHLLPANRMHSRAPGDDREMVAARARFLSAGWYAFLARRLASLAVTYTGAAPAVIDSGCGEGYYTAALASALREAGKTPRIAGIDIAKESVRRAAKRDRDIEFAVASAYAPPFPDAAADLLLDCFSPLALDAFRRVLKPGGVFLYVVPGARHLFEMKEILYDKPYENEERETPYEGFSYLDVVRLQETLALPDAQSIRDLFAMTPYAWKTPRAGRERLLRLDRLTVTASFAVHVFRRDTP